MEEYLDDHAQLVEEFACKIDFSDDADTVTVMSVEFHVAAMVRAINMNVRGMGDEYHRIFGKSEDSETQLVVMEKYEEVKRHFRNRVRCSYPPCAIKQGACDYRFKVCGGCKFVYFCSRSCQKKAWRQHKSVCTELSHQYSL